MKNTDGFHIYGWMVNDLALQGGDLLAFALVFSFTKGHAGEYTGNTAYLSGWTGWTEKTARTHLANLVKKNLIIEVRGRGDNHPYCHYKLAPDFYEKHPVKITGSPGKNYPVKITTRIEYKEKNIEKPSFIPPTVQEVAEYVRTRAFADPVGFAKYFVELCTNSGWRMANGEGRPIVNWKNYIVSSWEKNNKNRIFSTPTAGSLQPMTNEEFNQWLR